ncbi:MAG: DUF2142 domain-containing protein [Chloroflexi bacterium]|nr:DUF2142 domain-containing protein [Chloroflexota bacterium]
MRHPLTLILLGYFLLGILFSFIVPLNEAPDEADHFLYVQYLVENGRLPTMHPIATANATMEANQPPLFYALNALFLQGQDFSAPAHLPLNACYNFDPLDEGRQTFYLHHTAEQWPYASTYLAHHWARFISVLIGAITVATTYWLGWLVSQRRDVATVSAALVAFNPQFLFINASVNNDVLMAALGALIVALCVWVAKRPTLGRVIWLGTAVGLGLLTKFALFAFWPLALLAVWWKFGEEKYRKGAGGIFASARLLRRSSTLVLLLPLLIAAWLYWRNWQLYGDPLVWAVHLAAKGEQVLRTTPLGWRDLGEFFSVHFRSFWGLFGWLNVQLAAWHYAVYGLLMAAGAWGWLKNGRLFANRWLIFPLLASAAIYASLGRYALTINWSGYQGRLAFAAIAPLAVLLAVGLVWGRGAEERRSRGAEGIVLVILLFGLAGWSVVGIVRPAYPTEVVYRHTLATTPTCARFGNGLWVDGYSLPAQITADERVPLQIWGYATAAGSAPLRAEWLGWDGQPLGETTAALSWSAGEAISTTLWLPAPQTAVYPQQLLATLHMGDVPATSANGRLLESPFVLARRSLVSGAPIPPPQTVLDEVWDGRLRLVGYDAAEEDGQLNVRLVWETLAPSPPITPLLSMC